MGLRFGIGIALAMCAVAEATEPPASAQAKPAAIPAKPVAPAKPPDTPKAVVRKPLDLRVGDVREYMKMEEYRALLDAPDPDKNTIVVEGTRLLPMEKIENVPMGLSSLWYAAKHPTNAWRLLAPVVNAPEFEKPSPVPPPIFRWGP